MRRAILPAIVLAALGCRPTARAAEPWWRTYTTVVSHANAIKDFGQVAPGAVRSAGYFGGWYGFWFLDAQRARGQAARMWKRVGDAGAKRIVYYDAGEVGDYAGFFAANGKMIYNGWSLPWWKGEPVTARWFGLEAFMADVPWAPFPTAKHYGLPRFTAPEGAKPAGFYDLLAAQDIQGKWEFSCFSNKRVTDDVAQKTGLAGISGKQQAKANVQGKTGWQTTRLVHVDYSNPQLRDYIGQDIARLIEATKPDGVHIDNFGDLNILYPWRRAFGVWSKHRFREYMTEHFSEKQLKAMGIDDIRTFDIRAYIEAKPFESRGKRWHYLNRRWTRDRIWMCYVLSKVEAGLDYHRSVYRAAKQAAARAGVDCAVFGNTVPLFPGRTFMKGACDIAHFEWKTTKRFGPLPKMGLPPHARVGYATRLGAAISAAPYCWPSIYVPKRYSGKGHENLHKVLAFDCLANRGLLDYNHWYLDGYSPGTPESAGFINRFIKANAARLGPREYLADVGLVFCDWSNLASLSVSRPYMEMFAVEYIGWANFMSKTHRQWDVVLSHEMTLADLKRFPILVLPSVLSLTDKQVRLLRGYLRAGGRVVATGMSGTRYGPEQQLMPRPANALDALGRDKRMRRTTNALGVAYLKPEERQAAARQMADLIDSSGFQPRLTTDASESVGVNVSIGASALTLDLNNYAIDPETDKITPTPSCTVTLRLPAALALRDLSAKGVVPGDGDPPGLAIEQDKERGTLTLRVPAFDYYLLVTVQ